MPPNPNGNAVPIFGDGAGTIYNPRGLVLNCAYLSDSGSRGKVKGCGVIFCPDPPPSDPWCSGQPYLPSALKVLLEGFKAKATGSYNEVIIDSSSIDEHLPYVVDAFFYIGDASQAQLAHRKFLQEYGEAVATVPLVRLNVHNWAEPFSQG